MEHNVLATYSMRRLVAVLSLVAVATVFAYCRPWRNRSADERAEWIAKKISKELDLTEEQNTALARMKEEILTRHRAEKAQRDAQFQELTALVKNDTVDRAKLNELKKKHIAMRNGMEDLFIEKGIEFHKLLTPEQRVKAADVMQKQARKFDER